MNNRDYRISLIRFIAMNMIILCHILQYMDNELAWWFNVGVQIFLFMSGFLYAKKKIYNVFTFYKNNAIKILIPFFLVIIPVLIIKVFFFNEYYSKMSLLKILFALEYVPGGEHFWFIEYILICYLITPIFKSIYSYVIKKNKLILKILSIILLVTFLFVTQKYISSSFIFCYILGLIIGSTYEDGKNSKLMVLIFVLCASMNISQILLDYVFKVQFSGDLFVSYKIICEYAHVLLGATLFLFGLKIFKPLLKSKKRKIIEWLCNTSDKYSYNVYLVHQFMILGPLSLMALTNHRSINILIIYLLIIVFAIINHYISHFITKKLINNNKS